MDSILRAKPGNPWPPFLLPVLRRALPRRIYRRYIGRHEEGSIRLWKVLAGSVPEGTAILDIGAYEGVYALSARQVNAGASVYAFEPNPSSLERLTIACTGKRIDVMQVAFAEASGTVSFLCDSATSRIVQEPSDGQVVKVRSLTLDDWRADRSVAVSLMKIDTEGAEAAILRGGKTLLGECHPIILCEVLSDSAGEAVMKALPDGYRYYRIDENKTFEERERITRDNWRDKNWLFVPAHRSEEVEASCSR
jgi:FkbM family methyltransferase